jgi:hypothetical protein
MINIGPIEDMPQDLRVLLINKRMDLRDVVSYGVVSTTASHFEHRTISYTRFITNRMTDGTVDEVEIEPGEWQPGAMRYFIYLIK